MKRFFAQVLSYIGRHSLPLAALALSLAAFFAVFFLYSLPLEPVLYAAVISLLTFTIFGVLGFIRYRRRLTALERVCESIHVSVEELPPPSGRLEAQYRLLAMRLCRERAALTSQSDIALSEMTEYYTMWAHQIKTPISAMRLVLRERGDDPELGEQLFRIEQYVDMALGYMRSENISADLLIRRCPLDDIIKQALKKYSRSFARKRLTLNYEPSGQTVLTDEKWLCFVIEQLLSNALKYTREGSISVFWLGGALNICDTGIGIRAEDLPRITEKGFTGYNGHMDKRSTGIGLYLCRRVLGKLSHRMEISSEEGRGTQVRIFFD